MSHKFALAAVITGSSLLGVVLVPFARAQAAASVRRVDAPAVYECSVSISYLPANGPGETYQQIFDVAVGAPFVEDFSTPTREHTFSATATQQGNSVVIEVDYFSDVSALNWVDLNTALALNGTQRVEQLTGRHQFGSSLSGSYTLAYTLEAVRK